MTRHQTPPSDNAQVEASDEQLLRAHVDGDPAAFAELVRRHQDRLWSVAVRTIGNREDAADALQEALISAYRRAASFRGDAAVTTWLHRIVINACLDRIRRNQVRAADPITDVVEATLASPDTAEQRDRALDIHSALATLPVEQRTAIVLVDLQGYSVDAAAEILDCSPGTIKSRCSRGRAKLAPLLLVHDPRRNRSSASNVPTVTPNPPSDSQGSNSEQVEGGAKP